MLVSRRGGGGCLRVPKNALLVVVIDARSRDDFLAFLSREVLREYSFTQNSTASSSLNSKRRDSCGATNFSLSDASSSSSSSFTSSPRAHASLNTLLDSRAKKLIITLSLFDKAFFVFFVFFFFFFFSGLLARLFFSLRLKVLAFEKERSLLTHLYYSLSLFCV